ncbi:MAG: phosphoenolpyruvate--protein phosphotransferase [Planctomycetota bacterium]
MSVRRGAVLRGVGLSPGVVMGPVYFVDWDEVEAVSYPILKKDVKREQRRFQVALDDAKRQIRSIQDQLERQRAGSEAGIFGVHVLILDDPSFADAVQGLIDTKRINAEAALGEVVSEWESQLLRLDDPTHRERVLDLRDVRNRLLRILLEHEQADLKSGEGKFIVCARELLPSTTVHLDKNRLLGIVTEVGGPASHAAILARSFGIPAVGGIEGLGHRLAVRSPVIVDGRDGVVIADPTERQLTRYGPRLQSFDRWREARRTQLVDTEPAVTPDGTSVELLINVENFDTLDPNLVKACDGVGLYRTEFLFMGRDSFPSEREQYDQYRTALEMANGLPVTFRTIDIGGDKPLSYLKTPREDNPVLGWRGIRISFEWPDVFYAQLRALLRASRHGDLRIMLPMVTTLEEVHEACRIVADLERDLVREGAEARSRPPLGIMIEVPAAALHAEALLQHVDFVSIGTNDLVQYVMAADRNNVRVQHLYQPLNPAILRLLASVIRAGDRLGKSVSVCGEMAGQAETAVLLLGLGLRRFSTAPVSLPVLKELIRRIPLKEARHLAQRSLAMGTAAEVRDMVLEELKRLIGPAPVEVP